jgi:hypothetical protein
MVVVFAYCGCDWNAHPKIMKAADNLPSHSPWTPSLRWLAQTPIFPNAGEAFQFQIRHNLHGHGAFVAGEWHTRATWYYFVALSINDPSRMALLIVDHRPTALCIVRPGGSVLVALQLELPRANWDSTRISAGGVSASRNRGPRFCDLCPLTASGLGEKWLAAIHSRLRLSLSLRWSWPADCDSNELWGGPRDCIVIYPIRTRTGAKASRIG